MIGKTTTLFVALGLLLLLGSASGEMESRIVKSQSMFDEILQDVMIPGQRPPLPTRLVYVTETPKIVYITHPPEVVTVLVNSATLISYGLGASLVFILLATL